MKKTTFLSLIILMFFAFSSNAINYYVDPDAGDDANDGLTWATAVQTLEKAAKLAGENEGWDNILVKGGTISFTTGFNFASGENYYGSCAGTESSPDERPKSDLDGNGAIDPWEFTNPTVLSSTYVGQAFTLPNSNIVVDGFSFTHTATNTEGNTRTVNCNSPVARFQNNIISNCSLQPTLPAGSIGGILLKTLGNVSNVLIEKNTVELTVKSNGGYAGVEVIQGTNMNGCVIRNNSVTADYSGISTLANSNGRGLILVIAPSNTATDKAVVSNTLIHNNEAIYKPNDNSTMSNGAIVAMNAFSASTSTDSIVNCVIANNKATNLNNAGLKIIKTANVNHYAINNVIWNNKLDGVTSNLWIGKSLTTGLIANNIMNGGATNIDVETDYVKNNLTDLADDNTGTSSGTVENFPEFTNPTDVVGIAASASKWDLRSTSYLIGKGTPTTIKNDFIGNPYASSPAVGSYEYKIPTSNNQLEAPIFRYSIHSNGIELTEIEAGNRVLVYGINGALLYNKKASGSEISIPLSKGIYILRVADQTAKVIIK